jgi:hypothetical protein
VRKCTFCWWQFKKSWKFTGEFGGNPGGGKQKKILAKSLPIKNQDDFPRDVAHAWVSFYPRSDVYPPLGQSYGPLCHI